MDTICSHEICPYTLTPLADLAETSIEHIFPESIGGIVPFSVITDKRANSDLGTRVDAPMINSPTVTSLRQALDVGSKVITYEGTAPTHNVPITIQFDPSGKRSEHVIRPGDLDPNAKSGEIFYGNTPGQEKNYMRRVEAFYDKLGKDVEWQQPGQLEDDLHVDNSKQVAPIIRGLAKIAYLAVYEYLGDAYLKDPLVSEWHNVLFAPRIEDALTFNIRCVLLHPDATMILPETSIYEHAVSVVSLPGKAPIAVAVSLFGHKELSFYAVASEVGTYGLEPYRGQVIICNTNQHTISRHAFEEIFEIKTS